MELIIEPSKHGVGFDVFRLGVHPKTSVLAGQMSKQFLNTFIHKEDAIKKYPHASVHDHITVVHNSLPSAPPAWFDEAAAGERWDDDY